MIRIVFISTGLSTGGAEAMLLKLLEHIDRSRFDPHVISLTTMGEVGPRIAALGIPVHALGMTPGRWGLGPAVRLISLLKTVRPDIVQTWMYHADLIGGVAARLAGCRRVVWALRNSNLSDELTKRSTLLVVRACASLSSLLPIKILSCSARAGEVHADIGYRADKIQVIPNGFDLGRFRPDRDARSAVRAQLGVPLDSKLVGLMARYDPQKNHAGFIEAAAMVRDQCSDVHFLLAGSSIDEKNISLTTQIAAHGLGDCVHLLGRRDDMPRLMASLDVLASSSYGEAFPNVLGEAMACGVPCVVTDVGDSAEIVGDTGRVVSAGAMKRLGEEIVGVLQMAREERIALGQRARARVKSCYEIGHVTRIYEAVYQQLLASVETP